MSTTPEEFLLYPEQVREAARTLLIQCRTGFTSDVLPELARLLHNDGVLSRVETALMQGGQTPGIRAREALLALEDRRG